jgi:hypothetical protein
MTDFFLRFTLTDKDARGAALTPKEVERVLLSLRVYPRMDVKYPEESGTHVPLEDMARPVSVEVERDVACRSLDISVRYEQ